MTLKRLLNRVSLSSLLVAAIFLTQISYAQTDSEAVQAEVDTTAETSTESSAAPAAAPGEIPTDAESLSAGESLFKANCASCHRVDQKLVGPALKGVTERAPSIDWIVSFVQNSQKMIAAGDEYAVNLYNEYNQVQMTAFPTFERAQILNILGYIQQQSAAAPPTGEPDSLSGNQPIEGTGTGTNISTAYLNAIMIGLIIVLALILVVLILITTVLKKYLLQREEIDEDDRKIITSSVNISKVIKSPTFIFLATFIFAAVAFKVVINQLYAVGIQKGYAPTQPIAFSHQLHAGQYEIDCQYCHTGVRKSKNANIPSPNICMNCHSAIKTESLEIQKIYAAIDNDSPIQWVRVHTLPDLAYFNHSQHVTVGNIECQTCHGAIQEMEVVGQVELLTMGWCIDCHRQTDVNTKGNEYYDNLVELHSETSKDGLKVEDIGGLECSKCHY
jgi:mono/diheme cytochrome c family protein